ncbi:MAG: rod shape-determining protein [Clostridia bacterium]|nr:rod shape-determining protein [Clostridia bacterium]
MAATSKEPKLNKTADKAAKTTRGDGFFHRLLRLARQETIGMDIGSDFIRICTREQGILLEEPSVVSVSRMNGEVLRYGRDALQLVGRSAGAERSVRPIRSGAVEHYNLALQLIQYFLRSACGTMIRQPNVVLSVPSGLNDVQTRNLMMALSEAGVSRTYLVETSRAAAMGAGVNLSRPVGRLVVDIGSGKTELALLSLNGVVQNAFLPWGGRAFDAAILQYLRTSRGLLVGEERAERIKWHMGLLSRRFPEVVHKVKGRNQKTGLPFEIFLSSAELEDPLAVQALRLVEAIQRLIEKAPPELLPDILNNGILLTGGGSQLRGLGDLITRMTGVKTVRAETPQRCVILGLRAAIVDMKKND